MTKELWDKLSFLANIKCISCIVYQLTNEVCEKCYGTKQLFHFLTKECECACHVWKDYSCQCNRDHVEISSEELDLIFRSSEEIGYGLLNFLRENRISYQIDADAETPISFCCRKQYPGPWYYGTGVKLEEVIIDGIFNFMKSSDFLGKFTSVKD